VVRFGVTSDALVLSALATDARVPPDWAARFGPITRVGAHAGVQVLRAGDTFLKVHDEAARGLREAAALRSGLPLRTPRVLETATTASGQLVLVLEDVRRGAPRPARLTAEQLPAAARLLAGVHAARVAEATPSDAWVDRTRARFRDPRLPEALRSALAGLVLFGDAFCHQDLHASNWILQDGVPVGLIDWASSGWADPELDLAQLVASAGGDPALVDGVAEAWGDADRARIALYLWLLVAEREIAKGEAHPHATAIAARAVSEAPHGARHTPRAVAKREFEGTLTPEVPLWDPVPDPGVVAGALGRLGLSGPLAGYRLHACNDVLRLDVSGRPCVLKIYNKPVWGPLFELERVLAERLEGSPAVVLAPVALGGQRVFRVAGRPAAIYPYAGDQRLGNTLADLERLALAQAALHSLTGLAARFPELDRKLDDLPAEIVLRSASGRVGPDDLALLAEAIAWVDARIGDESGAPEGLMHGSFHRDHAAWWPGRGVVVFDLEKARYGPVVRDVTHSAVYAGYRGNDEKADPKRIIYYLRAWHSARPFQAVERERIVPYVIRALLRDVKSLAQEGVSDERMRRHVAVVREFWHNRANLETGLRLNLA
jgi:Ser/Thr protein kinase RdoA (MazF antagonist)